MKLQTPQSSFDDLEKQLAKDALEEALKALHGEIILEIAKNKNTFSEEIKKTLESFRQNIEQSVSKEIDKKLSTLLEDNFQDISKDVKDSFEKAFSPVLNNTKNDMQRLHVQGESTLNSWGTMMDKYKSIWTKPFFIMFAASIFTGLVVSFVSSYFLMRQQKETMKTYENLLISYKNTAQFYFEKEKMREKKENNTQSQTNKKKK